MHPLLKQHQQTLLGRLRTKIFTQITKSNDRLPTTRELWRFHMQEWKQNATYGRILFHLTNVNEASLVSLPSKLSRQQVRATLRRLANQEAAFRKYVEVEISGEDVPRLGCLLLGHTKPDGEPGYYAAILTEDAFPSCGYVSIVPSREPGKSVVSELHADGWHDLTATNAGNRDSTRLALVALNEVPDSQGRISGSMETLRLLAQDEPPFDAEYARRLKLVLRKKMDLSRAVVAAERVYLFAPGFSAQLQPAVVSSVANRLLAHRDEILVYWDGARFVSSDDYYLILGYQSLSETHLPVVIMGEFPQEIARSCERGGRELLPPPLVLRDKVMPGLTNELLTWQAEQESHAAKRLPPPSDLMVTWVIFAEMLAEEDGDERSLHNYLEKNPIMMGSQWDSVESEVRLGGHYKADFVLRAVRALPTVRLVELERANHRLFTKDLHETDEVTHAVQQVSDWLRWWRENPEHQVASPSRRVDPEGIVVIGRSIRMSERERETLAHNNQHRKIKVITYDELLDDFGSLILHRLDDSSP